MKVLSDFPPKVCNQCKIEKPATDFHPRRRRARLIAVSPYCRPCTAARQAKRDAAAKQEAARHFRACVVQTIAIALGPGYDSKQLVDLSYRIYDELRARNLVE
jgi:hypothetical protein